MTALATPRILWPVTVSSGANVLRVTAAATADVTIAAGDYYVSGDGTASDLCQAIADALETAHASSTWTLTVSTTGRVTIARTEGNVSLLWTHANTTFPGTAIGFDDTADDTGAATYTSDWQHQGGWYPEEVPVSDSFELPQRDTKITIATSGVLRAHTLATHTYRDVAFRYLEPEKALQEMEATATTNEAFQRFYSSAAAGNSFRYYPNVDETGAYSATTNRDGYSAYVIRSPEWCQTWPMERMSTARELFEVSIPMRNYVS